MKFKKILATVVAGAMCLSLAACSGQQANAAQSSAAAGAEVTQETLQNTDSGEEKVVSLTESWEFTTGFYPVLTASNSTNYGSTFWNNNFYDTLVRYDENGEIVGALAETWEMSDDGLTFTFHLRDGVKFSDGTDLNAQAVKTSFEAVVQNLGMYNGSYGKLTLLIASMDAPDENTFVMTLSQPYYGTLNDLTMYNPLAIVNPAAFNDDLTPKDEMVSQTMGTGAYMYAGDFDGTTYTFVRNPYYWGEAPEVDSFQVKVIEDNDAKVLALRSGEIDAILGASRLGYDAYSELSQDGQYGASVNEDATRTRYLGFNFAKAPFDDVKVRQAVAHSIDRDTLSTTVFQGIETPAETLFQPSQPYCDVQQTTYAYDLEKANALMEEAGWVDSDGDGVREKDGEKLEIKLPYMTDYGTLDDAVLAIAAQLSEIGFSVTPDGTDMMTWFSATTAGDYAITVYQTYGGAYDPSTVLTNINTQTSTDPVAMQFSAFLSGGDALITELDSTADDARVQEIYTEILTTIADQALLAPISYTREFAAWNADKIGSYDYYPDPMYVNVAGIHLK